MSALESERPNDEPVEDLRLPRRIHLVGIGGAGLSGVARLLSARGHVVTGSDHAESPMLDALRELDLEIAVGPTSADSLPAGVELVGHTAAVQPDEPQLVEARARGVEVVKYARLLARLADPGRGLAVAGTHGKTTTAWMLWNALEGASEVSRDPLPGALIGGLSRRLGTNALAGSRGGWFACEACEYDRSFLALAPHGAVITNVEGEHLDYYGDEAAVIEAFAQFAERVDPDGLLVLGEHVPASIEERARARVWRLGREVEVELKGEERGRFGFLVTGPGFQAPRVDLEVPGRFNVENAACALALAVGVVFRDRERCGVEVHPDDLAEAAARGLTRFRGVRRRFESWGRVGSVEVVHDYAHHPTEVRVTLEAAARAFPRHRVCVLFQPHQHSRTARFLDGFVESMRSADLVCVTDVYGARRHQDGNYLAGAADLAQRLARAGVHAFHGGPLSRSVRVLLEELPERAVVLVVGAGDIEGVKQELLGELALRRTTPGGPRP